MSNRQTLWMRYVEFRKIKDLLFIIDSKDNELRPTDLERVATEEKILCTNEGKPFGHSTRYHYRKVLENLGLAELVNGKYRIKRGPFVMRILEFSKKNEPLNESGIEAFCDLIINNSDCRKHYFDYFVEDENYDLNSWRSNAISIRVETKTNMASTREELKGMPHFWIRINNEKTGKVYDLQSYDKISAIIWGIRRWATDLGLTDEYVLSSRFGKIIFPLSHSDNYREHLRSSLLKILRETPHQGDIFVLSLPELVAQMSKLSRTKIEYTKQYLVGLKYKFPAEVRFIKTSRAMAVHSSSFQRQDPDMVKLYLREVKDNDSQIFISNLILQEKIIKYL